MWSSHRSCLLVLVQLLGSSVATYSLFVIVIGLLLLAALWYLFNRTRVGRIMPAAALDRDMAEALCINTRMVVTGVFAFGAWAGCRWRCDGQRPCARWIRAWETRLLSSRSLWW